MSFDMNPADERMDEEEMFVLAIADLIDKCEMAKAKVHLRAYIDHVLREQIATAERRTRLDEATWWHWRLGVADFNDCTFKEEARKRIVELEAPGPEVPK